MQFINATGSLVVDALDGLLRSSGGANLARLDGYPGIKVALRTDHKPGRVAVVAGGGSGHQPAHAVIHRLRRVATPRHRRFKYLAPPCGSAPNE